MSARGGARLGWGAEPPRLGRREQSRPGRGGVEVGSGGGVAKAELGWGVPFPTRITTLSSNGAPREDGCAPSLGAGAYSPRQAVQAAEPVGKPPASSFSIAGPHSFIHGCPRCACRRRGMPRERQAGGPALAATRPARTGARHRQTEACASRTPCGRTRHGERLTGFQHLLPPRSLSRPKVAFPGCVPPSRFRCVGGLRS